MPQLSAVVPTDRGFDAVRATLWHLSRQTRVGDIEVVLVGLRGQVVPDAAALEAFACWQLIEVDPPATLGKLNAAGLRAARASVIALCEDHSFPEPEWAHYLLQAHQGDWAMVGPAVVCANPATCLSWVDYALGYGPWSPPVAGGPRDFLPGHNSSYKRSALQEVDGQLDDLLAGFEMWLHIELRRRGHQLLLEPRAITRHINFSKAGTWLAVKVPGGRLFAATRSLHWPWWKRLAAFCAAPLIPIIRFYRTLKETMQNGRESHWIAGGLPYLIAALVLDGIGQMIGFVAGPGNSAVEQARGEYNRIDNVIPADRKLWDIPQ